MCRAIVLKETLIFASIGLAAELAIVLLIGFGSRLDFFASVLASAVGLYLAACMFGFFAGSLLCSNKLGRTKLILLGILVALGSLLLQVLCGSSVEFLRNFSLYGAFVDYVFKPVFWVMFLGFIPATMLGLIYALRLQKNLTME